MQSNRKELIHDLLKGIETGDPASVAVVNQQKYIQHNPQTHEGGEGLEALFKRLSKSNPTVNIVRIFEDGDYVFAHTEYNFTKSNVGFEVFRFEGDQAVEHWDNIQLRQSSNSSGHSMVDGPTQADNLDKSEVNKKIIKAFINNVLINNQIEVLEQYIDTASYIEHNSQYTDEVASLLSSLSKHEIVYKINHRLLAEGSFVLSVSEGSVKDVHSSFYDLFRIASGKIVEHWDTTEAIPSRDKWKNHNGKF